MRDSLRHPPPRLKRSGVRVAVQVAAEGEHRASHRGVPQQVAPEHLGVQKAVVQQKRARQREGDESADDVRREFSGERRDGGGKLRDVFCRRPVRRLEPLVQEVRELVELAHLPARERGPLPLAGAARVVVEALDVVQQEEHDEEGGDEGRQNEVHRRQNAHAMAQRVDVVELRPDGEVVVEHPAEDGLTHVPLHRLREPDAPSERGDARDALDEKSAAASPGVRSFGSRLESQTEHVAVQHPQQVVLLAQDARDDVVLVEVLRDAQPCGSLQVHDARHHLGPRHRLDVAVRELQLAHAKRAHL
mmetsp:Transcript_4306/g.18305  ORF Transcript_4306/g.18305 Transcript_4306/m.18305 type:complete len:304 (+) Transcript_4306:2577-3488(+)